MKGFELVFFRHGIAADSAPDSSRPLTEDGIRKTYSSAEGLKKMAIPFDRVFTSPWLRASQTAKILSEVLMIPAPEEMPELAGDHTAAELLEALHNCQSRCFLLVGHQPLRKSGACSIQLDDLPPKKSVVLNWLLTSKQLRAVGK